MGWMFVERPKGTSHREFFARELDHVRGHVIDAASVGFTEVYLAYELSGQDEGDPHGVVGIACRVAWRHDLYNFGYEEFCESVMPHLTNCPQRILDQLTEYDFGDARANERSRNWRTRCRAAIERRQSRPRLAVGDLVLFPERLFFTNGVEAQVLRVVQAGRRLRFALPFDRRTLRVRRHNLDGAKVIGSPSPRDEMQPSAPLAALIESRGADLVGQAFRYAWDEEGLDVLHALDGVPADGVVQLLEEAIVSSSFAAWQANEEAA
jgi:hypothetical protein